MRPRSSISRSNSPPPITRLQRANGKSGFKNAATYGCWLPFLAWRGGKGVRDERGGCSARIATFSVAACASLTRASVVKDHSRMRGGSWASLVVQKLGQPGAGAYAQRNARGAYLSSSIICVMPSRAGIYLPLCVLANRTSGPRSVPWKLVNRFRHTIRSVNPRKRQSHEQHRLYRRRSRHHRRSLVVSRTGIKPQTDEKG